MAAQIFSAIYSQTPVYEINVEGTLFMRRIQDGYINATQLLKIAGLPKSQRIRILENEVTAGEHFKVRGGYSKFQGTWVPLEIGRELSERFGVADSLKPILYLDENTKSQVKPGTSAKYLQFILDGACNQMGKSTGQSKRKRQTAEEHSLDRRVKLKSAKRSNVAPLSTAISPASYHETLSPAYTNTYQVLNLGNPQSAVSNLLRMSADTLSPTLPPLTNVSRPLPVQHHEFSISNFNNPISPTGNQSFFSDPQHNSFNQPLSPNRQQEFSTTISNICNFNTQQVIVNTLSPQSFANPLSPEIATSYPLSPQYTNFGNSLSSLILSPGQVSSRSIPLSPDQNAVSPATYVLSPTMSNEGPVMVSSPVSTHALSPVIEPAKQTYGTPKGLFPAMVNSDTASNQSNQYPTFFFSDPRNRAVRYDPLLDPVLQRKIAKGKVATTAKPNPRKERFEAPLEDADSNQELENLFKSLDENKVII
ncbi:hypothetical protein HDV01_001256 [Terramyces sp. JEL0728]|nr:hypothetical protein HDV01_001256 [Terramyces sp. JEL0728]